MPFSSIIAILVADEIMIVCGLVGALISTRYKWAYWAFGMVAFFFVVYGLIFEGRRHANVLGGSVKKTYMTCGVLTIFVWFLYPIAWGVSEGGNVIHPDSEAVFYGILDLIAKPVFGFLLLWGHRSIDPLALGLHMREAGTSGENVREKHTGNHSHIGAHNGGHDGPHNGAHDGVQSGQNGTQAEMQTA